MQAKQVSHLVAVHAADDLVDDGECLGLKGAALLALSIVQVVGVDDSHHVLELVGPAAAVVVPVQVLWLLQHRHVSLCQNRPRSLRHACMHSNLKLKNAPTGQRSVRHACAPSYTQKNTLYAN